MERERDNGGGGIMRDFMGLHGRGRRSSGEMEGTTTRMEGIISSDPVVASSLSETPLLSRGRQIEEQVAGLLNTISSSSCSSFPTPSIYRHGGGLLGQTGLSSSSRPNFATSSISSTAPAALGALWNNWVEKAGGAAAAAAAVTAGEAGAGGFTGLSSASMQQESRPQFTSSLFAGNEKDVAEEEDAVRNNNGERTAAQAGKPTLEEVATAADIQQLSREDCWRLILEVGTQWPSCDRTLGLQSQQGLAMEKKESPRKILEREGPLLPLPPPPPPLPPPLAEKKRKSEGISSDTMQQQKPSHHHQMGNNKTSRMLASRALEELACTPPPRSASFPCVFPSSADAPASTKGVSNGSVPTGVVAAAAAAIPAALTQQPSHPPTPSPVSGGVSSQVPTHSRVFGSNTSSGRQTAQLTIFYAGAVNVFNNVTQEKAHLIMLLAANGGASWTSALAKFISSQGSSAIMSAPSKTNAATAKTPVQNSVTPANPPPPHSPPPASVSTTSAACGAPPNVAPALLPLPSAQNSAAKLLQQQQNSSLSQFPVLVNIRDSLTTIVPPLALLPPAAAQCQSVMSQGPFSQKQALLPEQSRTVVLNVKGEQSTVVVSLATNAPSMQAERKNNTGLSVKQGNELQQLEHIQEASNPNCAPAANLNAMRGSSVCYTQELPHARKTSLVRFLDMRQRQKRAQTTSSQQNSLNSKTSVDRSPPPSDLSLSLQKSEAATAAVASSSSSELRRQPPGSSPTSTTTLLPMEVKNDDISIPEKTIIEKNSAADSWIALKIAARDREATVPMEIDTVVVPVVGGS